MRIVVRFCFSACMTLISFMSVEFHCIVSFLSMVESVLIDFLFDPIFYSRICILVSNIVIYRTTLRWSQRFQLVVTSSLSFCFFPCASVIFLLLPNFLFVTPSPLVLVYYLSLVATLLISLGGDILLPFIGLVGVWHWSLVSLVLWEPYHIFLRLCIPMSNARWIVLRASARALHVLFPNFCWVKITWHDHCSVDNSIGISPPLSYFDSHVTLVLRRVLYIVPYVVLHAVAHLLYHLEH